MMSVYWRARLLAACLTVGAAALLAGCDDQLALYGPPGRAQEPIPQKTLAKIDAIGSTANAPVLIRAFKQEAEFEVWKQKPDGQYALLKSYPICRWSGQLGPKKKQGDRQVPEGFYTIAPAQMNPNSSYYLSFNVGYPNAYDRAYGRDGGDIMVHGICSSAGCFSMTDAGIAEIYALTREAFRGGQQEIQLQSYPFRMTADNLAKHRLDPNIAFWKELKNGNDHFETALVEPSVLVCGKHYVFGATAKGEVSATATCPKLERDEEVEAAVAEKTAKDDAQVAQLVAKGVKPIQLVYEDGGQNVAFAGKIEASRPEALVAGPKEIALDGGGKPLPAAVQMASGDYRVASANSRAAPPPLQPARTADAPSSAATPAFGLFGDVAGSDKNMMASLIDKVTGKPTQTLAIYEPAEPIPSDAPLPPRRNVARATDLRLSSADASTQ